MIQFVLTTYKVNRFTLPTWKWTRWGSIFRFASWMSSWAALWDSCRTEQSWLAKGVLGELLFILKTYYKTWQVILQFTTARLITIYDNVLLQFTISWLSQFSTTVITIYDRCYNFMTGITIHDRGTCWHYLMMSQYKKISLFSKRICQVINQTRYLNVSLSEKAKRLNSTWPISHL